ncbi:hypothetical protein D4S03_07955 [bacterium]|nr:MAG: hypothetical protein D4S03_07955 [bacterium]
MQTDKKQSVRFFWVFEYIWLKHADFGGRVWGLSGCLCLPESNKVSTSMKMQYFNQLSMMLFPNIFGYIRGNNTELNGKFFLKVQIVFTYK